jgi:cytochrome c oxidase cbb3-type subunit 3
MTSGRALMFALIVPALAGCKREVRELRTDPPVADALDRVAPMPNRIGGAPPVVLSAMNMPYENNAWQLNQGKQLYTWFNCVGCHAHGGGASGPALMNGWWRYGPDVVSVYLSIRDGRPNGMPAFRDRLTPDQIWQLTGYVRTIGAYTGKTAAPGRNDEMQSRPAENRAPAASALAPPPAQPRR